jgi:hypothetical protein
MKLGFCSEDIDGVCGLTSTRAVASAPVFPLVFLTELILLVTRCSDSFLYCDPFITTNLEFIVNKLTIEKCSTHFSYLPFFFRLQIFALTEKTFYLGGAI